MRLLIVLVLALLAAPFPRSSHGRELHAVIEDSDGFTNLRNESGKVIGRIKSGEKVRVVQRYGKGARWPVRLASGRHGFVHESRIRIVEKPAAIPRAADTSLVGVFFDNPASAERVLGKEITTREEDNGFPTAHFLNTDRTEQLDLTLHYGAVVNGFSEFTVRAVGRGAKGRVLPRVPRFISGKGVRLGAAEAEVKAIFGKPESVITKHGARTLEYRVPGTSAYYDGGSGPVGDYSLYDGRYTFRGGKLAEFEFGFEYP